MNVRSLGGMLGKAKAASADVGRWFVCEQAASNRDENVQKIRQQMFFTRFFVPIMAISTASERSQPHYRNLILAARGEQTVRPGYCKLAENQLAGKRTGHRDERGIALELMYRCGGASQARMGELVGLNYTTVSRERKRLRDRLQADKHLMRILQQIETSVLL